MREKKEKANKTTYFSQILEMDSSLEKKNQNVSKKRKEKKIHFHKYTISDLNPSLSSPSSASASMAMSLSLPLLPVGQPLKASSPAMTRDWFSTVLGW